ncbi:uncharacterized protein LOC127720000 [Mytilus californianus]|uniref:uncharacterized protein LOC127720000 n=1 Tax=Mytilus californianus TaxID=6549 RepID=UPI00224778A0|nr:uncharacterized protein LOC127720000 [Mytilus californianus]
MKRSTVKPTMAKTDKEKKEMKRKTLVKREHKITDCFSSEMNTCQALVKPDGTKASIQKSLGIKRALYKTLSYCFPFTDSSKIEDLLEKHGYIYRDLKDFPTEERHTIRYATVEFAGIKFKTKASTGDEYLENINNVVINSLFNNKLFPNLQHIVICEEKYSFTPDDFKAATRQKRQKSMPFSISHLKIGDEIMSSEKLSKSAVLNTELGKRMISNYLARNISKLKIKRNLTLDVDSELVLSKCECMSTDEGLCPHIRYTTPVRATFTNEGYQNTTLLKEIKQMKGEAEMSQVDWLSNIKDELKEGESVVSIVTSADIDSIVIHLFALSIHWPRTTSGSFKNTVYVMLQKPKSEVFNITSIIEVLEHRFVKGIGRNIAIACCIGGNDYIPKFHGFSHEKWITAILDENSINRLVTFDVSNDNVITGILDEETFLDTVKRMYCPASVNANSATLEQVRQLSIKYPDKPFRPLVSWMPPKSALLQFIKLINCQIQYLLTAWKHDAVLPNFIGSGCLMKDSEGNIQYNFGSDIRIGAREDALTLPEDDIRILYSKKGKKKKRQRSANNTPTKDKKGKRKAVMSTPIKMKNKQDGAN